MPTAAEVADEVVGRLLNYPLPASGRQHLHAVVSNTKALAAWAVTLLGADAEAIARLEAAVAAVVAQAGADVDEKRLAAEIIRQLAAKEAP